MALEKEIWRSDIVGGLFKGNDFLTRSFNADEYVLAGKVVHIPQAGAASGIVKNRSSYPATAVRRTDTEVVYTIDEFTSNPVHIANIETVQYSYDKRQSVIQEDISKLRETVADWMLRNWAPVTAGHILRTTGSATAAKSPGATGNRKKFIKEDLKRARLQLNKENIPNEGRVALIPSDLMDALLDDPDLKVRDSSMELDMRGGVVTRLYGFDLMERSNVLTYTNAATPAPKDPGAATAATDNQTVLVWQQNAVERAMGTVDIFERIDDPLYYGSLFSFLVMMGGRIRRAGEDGILAIVEDASA